MKLQTPVTLLATIQWAAAHTVFTTLFIDDANQGDGTCVRMPMTPGNATFPINDLESDDMACGRDGTAGVARVCPVYPGGKLSFLFREYANGAPGGSIDASHKGPCAVYVKSTESAINSTATGDGWIKIWHEGHDEESDMWCTDRLIQNNGFFSVSLPQEMAGGPYLVRAEVLALHQADKNPPNPQFYVGCAQIFLKSGVLNNLDPQDTVSIPGYTNISDPAVLFNIYSPKFPYTPPGPPILPAEKYGASKDMNLVPSQEEGLLPPGAVLVNANWWGEELKVYTDEAGCNQAARYCFAQSKACYDTAPPTGYKGCAIWDEKCMVIQGNCDAGKWTGPPEQGKDLNPPTSTYTDIPVASNQESKSTAASLARSSSVSVEYITSFSVVQASIAIVTAFETFTSAFQISAATTMPSLEIVSQYTNNSTVSQHTSDTTISFRTLQTDVVSSVTNTRSGILSVTSEGPEVVTVPSVVSIALQSSSTSVTIQSLETVSTAIKIVHVTRSHPANGSVTVNPSFDPSKTFGHITVASSPPSSMDYTSVNLHPTVAMSARFLNVIMPTSLHNTSRVLSGYRPSKHMQATSVRFPNSTSTLGFESASTSISKNWPTVSTSKLTSPMIQSIFEVVSSTSLESQRASSELALETRSTMSLYEDSNSTGIPSTVFPTSQSSFEVPTSPPGPFIDTLKLSSSKSISKPSIAAPSTSLASVTGIFSQSLSLSTSSSQTTPATTVFSFSVPLLPTTTHDTATDIVITVINPPLHLNTMSSFPVPTPTFDENTIYAIDGLCGSGSDKGKGYQICGGSQQWGMCCGIDGRCGGDEGHCNGDVCQLQFGRCGQNWIGVFWEMDAEKRRRRRKTRLDRHHGHW